jgi:hypothetical protein
VLGSQAFAGALPDPALPDGRAEQSARCLADAATRGGFPLCMPCTIAALSVE